MADAYSQGADGQVRRYGDSSGSGAETANVSQDSQNTQDSQDTQKQKPTPVIASCQAVQQKLNAVFTQIDEVCPIVDAEIEGLDAEFLARATGIVQAFENALSGKNVSMKRYASWDTEGALILADENGKIDTKYMIQIFDDNDQFVLNIGNTGMQIIFAKYKNAEGQEKMWLKEIVSAKEEDVCKPASNPYTNLKLELSEQGPGYGHMLSKDFQWITFNDIFPEQGTFTCNIKNQTVECPSPDNFLLSNKIAYECNPLYIDITKSKIIPPEKGFAMAQQVLDTVKPLVTKVMTAYSKNNSWKKITWKAQE